MDQTMCYPKMKESGVDWIGTIPTHWKVSAGKRLAVVYSGKAIDGDGTVGEINVYGSGGAFKKTNVAMYSGEAVIFGRKGTIGKPLYVNDDFWAVDTIYYAVSSEDRALVKYLYYFLKVFDWEPYITHTAVPSIVANEVFEASFVQPPLDEQALIVSYLDANCGRIDEIINEAKASIVECEQWKASVIYEGVTKGVTPVQTLKDSEVSWIGSIPLHWRVSKIGRFIKIRSGITLGKTYPQGTELIEMPYLRVANVKAEGFALEDVAKIKVTPDEAEKYALKSGELLMTEGGDRDKLGRGTIWHEEISPCLHQNHVFAVTCDENWLLTEYLAYLTASPVGREYFDLTAKKTTNLASTNSNTIMQFKVPIPPIAEQREIVQMLDRKCAAINDLITEKQLLISDLELYKKSLIYEVVTGKRKVV